MGRVDKKAEIDQQPPKDKTTSDVTPSRQSQRACHSALVVDDDLFSRQVISSLLSSIGMTVHETAIPYEALELLSQATYDIVFLDIHLGELRGDELCRTMRTILHEAQYGCIVAITGGSEGPRPAPERSVCFDAVIYKPFDRNKLIQLTECLIKNQAEATRPVLNIAGLDVEAIHHMFEGHASPYEKFLHMLSQYNHSFTTDFEQSFGQNDIAKCQRLAHSIKGSMAFFGATDISQKAKHLELVCSHRETRTVIDSAYEQLTELIGNLIHDLKKELT